MNNKEKFLRLVSHEDTKTMARAQERIANYESRRIAFAIALKILDRLDHLGWSQKRLAEELGVSPQQVNKWVRGKENFTIETLTKIGTALDIHFIEADNILLTQPNKIVAFRSKSNKDSQQGSLHFSVKKKLNIINPVAKGYLDYDETFSMAAEPIVGYALKPNKSKTPSTIHFSLASVATHQFEIFETEGLPEKELGVNITLRFDVIQDQQTISCTLNYQMTVAEQHFIKLEVTCVFAIESEDLDKMKTDNKLIIPSEFARHLGVITSNTTRGVFHAKTENSIFNNYPMTLINMDEILKEDIAFDI